MPDTFRVTHRELPPELKHRVAAIKAQAEALERLLIANGELQPVDGRALALARTKLEECVMWAVKAVTVQPVPLSNTRELQG